MTTLQPSTQIQNPPIESALLEILKSRFHFDGFRSAQQKICEAVTQGSDALVVMPTGAGKSLCYQVPGLARQGTTLVISPLLALIDDQASKLAAKGLRVEQIHSGRSREASRAACFRYLQGDLDFLLIAPERLAVPGFPEMLQKRKPALIAIDEAHCISQWGHDFRPEYRRLGERLAGLRPAPIIALTATATVLVQDDIVRQLGIPEAQRFIQGFCRTNIAIRAHEVPVPERAAACAELLKDPKRRPAIIYTPTRKSAEEIAGALASKKSGFAVACYHAGLETERRDEVQNAFLSGKTEVIVATVAFGMGIDKPNIRTVIHAGLSGSVEGYYQEIGRAGRDGLPSQAILMHSFADQKTHDFFFERDYPEPRTVLPLYQALAPGKSKAAVTPPLNADELFEKCAGLKRETFEKALEKLLIHGGAKIDRDGTLSPLNPDWIKNYESQRSHRARAAGLMADFATDLGCRMLYFLRYFGDVGSLEPCGLCDRCDSESAGQSREPSAQETAAIKVLLAALSQSQGMSAGRLHEAVQGGSFKLDRRKFDSLIEALVRQGWIVLTKETFTNEAQKVITYRRISITDDGEAATAAEIKQLRLVETAFAFTAGAQKRSRTSKVRRRRSKAAATY